MSKTYAIITFNPATGMEETVLVTKEVYDEFRRGIWRIEKSDLKYITHTYPMSCLIGDDDDSEDEFHEYEDENSNLEEMIIYSERLEQLRCALKNLPKNERRLISAIYKYGLTEMEYGSRIGMSQRMVHYNKERILKKLKKFLKFMY